MPLGTQGTVVAYMRDKFDLLSAWMIMKRGCRLLFPSDTPANLREFAEKWGAVPYPDSLKELVKRENVLAIVSGRIEDCRKSRIPVLCPAAGLSGKDVEERLKLIFS